MNCFKFRKSPSGFTLMEILLTIGLLAIFGVFVLEFLTTAWLGTEKDLSRIKCITAAENVIELANSIAIEKPDEDLEMTYRRLLAFDGITSVNPNLAPPLIDVSTWTQIIKTSPVHPDGVGEFLAKIATSTLAAGTYTVIIGDQSLANRVEIQTAYATQPVLINYGPEWKP